MAMVLPKLPARPGDVTVSFTTHPDPPAEPKVSWLHKVRSMFRSLIYK